MLVLARTGAVVEMKMGLKKSTLLQVCVSIQGQILGSQYPYYNEPVSNNLGETQAPTLLPVPAITVVRMATYCNNSACNDWSVAESYSWL